MCHGRCPPEISAWSIVIQQIYNEVNYSVLNMVLKLYANDATGYNSDPLSLALQFMVNNNLYMFSTRFE